MALETTYHLCSLGASSNAKPTVAVKKEVRGAIKEGQDGGQNSGGSGGSHAAMPMKAYSEAEMKGRSMEAIRNGGTCEACQ
jgi:ribonucleoside-diphosphate reductase alpha chain